MFCVAKPHDRGRKDTFPALVLDYQDPADDYSFNQPPAVRLCAHLPSYQRLGMLPQVILVHYPDSSSPVVSTGALSWTKDNGYIFRSYGYESWSLDFDSCIPQNGKTKSLAEKKGLPIDAPVLSKHSERPLMKVERSIVGSFYSNGDVDGEKLARQWIAALTLVHHLSMARVLRCLQFKEEKLKKYSFEENVKNEFVIWWPSAKPSSLQEFVRQLWITRKMSVRAQNAIQILKPFHAGFYRCEVSDKELFLDDESNVPYNYVKRKCADGVFNPKTLRGKIIVRVTDWLQLIPSPDDSSHLKTVKQEEKNIGLFILPRSVMGLSRNVGVERSENVEFSYELWKHHIGTQKCDKSTIEQLSCDALENAKSLLLLGID